MEEKVGLLKRSSKGAAHLHIKDKQYGAVNELIADLQALFGVLRSAEELYFEMCQTRPTRRQCLSEFLLQLSLKVMELEKIGSLSEEEYHRRLTVFFTGNL